MSSLRNILRRCARNASILGGIPFQIQCTFNPVYSDPTSISRQAYSSDANEAPKKANDYVQKYILEMMNAKKSPNVTKVQKASKPSTFNKNLNLRKYYIHVRGLSKETTPESLREFYSQFGEIAVCNIVFLGEPNQFGSVAFSSREAVDRALNSLPHYIDGDAIKNVYPAVLAERQLTLKVLDVSHKTTTESLKTFYSKFGMLKSCWVNEKTTAKVGEVTFARQKDMHRALDAQPHVIDGSEVFLLYATFDLDLEIEEIPEGVTEEDLITFYSKYGQLRSCRLLKGKTGRAHAFVSYSAIAEVNHAMADRPHIIGGKPLQTKFVGIGHSIPVSLFVGSLPENVTEESLREEFSKYGKPIFWKLKNDGYFNQSGPYGIVSYSSEQEALKVLNSGPHTIKGTVVDVRIANEAKKSMSKSTAVNALNRGPHTIKGSVVDVRKAKKSPWNKSVSAKENSVDTDKNTVTLGIRDVTKDITEADLIEFYSKYGELRECRLYKGKSGIPHARVSFFAIDAVNRAMDDRPHIIRGKPLCVYFFESSNTVTIFVGSLPENVTDETLREEFSKYGKPVYWKLKNDGRFNQTGPYGIVTYSSEQEALNALNSGPHTIEGSVVDVRKAKEANKLLSVKETSNN